MSDNKRDNERDNKRGKVSDNKRDNKNDMVNNKIKIKLPTIALAQRFSDVCSYFNADILVRQGKQVIDGKSILGLFSLNLTLPLEVEIQTDDEGIREDFMRYAKIWGTDEEEE